MVIQSRPALPAAADALLAPVLGGPRRSAEVVLATPSAVYARADDDAVIGLLAPAAVRVPGSVVIATPARLPALGARLVLGGGGLDVALDGDVVRLVPRRWWDSRVPRVGPPAQPPGEPRAVRRLPGALSGAEIEAALAPDAGRGGTGLERAVAALIGLGPGLTPAGDDVVAGILVGLAAARADATLARLAAAVRPLRHRTTTVSAALLEHAGDGRAVPQLARYLVGLARGRLDPGVVQDLERVGATSGAALAAGARIGLRVASTARATVGERAQGEAEVA